MKFLFPLSTYSRRASSLLLALRLLFGLLLISHGFQKLMIFSALAGGAFPDPIGLGPEVSVALAVFAEFFCAIAFVAGFLSRLSPLPMIVTMFVAFFFAHGGSIAQGELAFVYLVVFILLYITGPGTYSVDHALATYFRKRAGSHA